MSRIRPRRLTRREATFIKWECADTLDAAALSVEQEVEQGRFDLVTGPDAAHAIALACRDTAPGYLRRSKLRGRRA